MVSLSLATEVLEWAARQSGESFDSIARTLTKSEQSLRKILDGQLTTAQAQKFAKEARIPFGLLFLRQPPETIRPNIPDLRQAPHPAPLSVDFFEVLEDAIRKQQWFKEYLQASGAGQLNFVGSRSQSSSPSEVAANIREVLGLETFDRAECLTQDDYYSRLSEKVEKAGILVLKSGIVKSNTSRGLSPREFRGFALSDALAPLVFINGKDWEISHVFTLMHEVSHIWIGQSGVSDFAYGSSKVAAEVFCNKVAAEVLVPEQEFFQRFSEGNDLTALARYFRVSRLVIARRAYDLKRIKKEDYDGIAAASANSSPPQSEPGGNPYATMPIRNSRRLTSALLKSALGGETLLRDAASLLNVRPSTVISLSQKMKYHG